MRAENYPFVLARLPLERNLVAVVIYLFTGARDQLLGKLGHDVIALAQGLSSNLHADIAHGVSTEVVGDRFLIVVEWGSFSLHAISLPHIEQIIGLSIVSGSITDVLTALAVNHFAATNTLIREVLAFIDLVLLLPCFSLPHVLTEHRDGLLRVVLLGNQAFLALNVKVVFSGVLAHG